MTRLFVPLLALAAAGGAAAAQARPAAAPAAAPGAQAPAGRDSAPPSPFKKFADLVKGATLRSGYFDTYEKGENLCIVPPKRPAAPTPCAIFISMRKSLPRRSFGITR